MGADERDGVSVFATEVSANTDDFEAFVEAGNGYERNLRSIFNSIAGARSRTLSVLGIDGTPPPLAAVSTGNGTDPFAELLAEASYNTRFVDEIYQTLTTNSAISTTGLAQSRSLNSALQAAGFSLDGTDLSLAEDQARIDAVEIRSDLEAAIGLGPGAGAGHQNPEIAVFEMGERFSQYLDGLSGIDDSRRAFIGQVMVDYGIDLQAGVRQTDPSDVLPERQASTLLTTHGLGLVPDAELGAMIDELAGRQVQVPNLSLKPALLLLVDVLDLDERSILLSDRGVGVSWNNWQGDSQPIYRQHQLDRIIRATMSAPSTSGGGAITAAGQSLVDYVLDTYPRIVATSETATLHQAGYDERSPIEIDLRATLATALVASNYGIDQADYEIGVRLGEVDQLLSQSPPAVEFDALWRERELLVALLVSERTPESDLLYEGMAQGLSAGDAMRLMHYAESPTLTNDRVRRLRLVYETNAFGQPLAVDQLNILSVADAVATPLMTELAALQSIQEARYNQRSDVRVQIPLTPQQIDLVTRYSEVVRWFHARFAGAYPGGHQAAMQQVVDDDLGWVLHGMPEGFEELAAELMAPENAIIWQLMPGAAGNDKFLGVNGTYRPARKDFLHTADPEALLVQMALLAKLGPHQAALDIGEDGIVDDDEVDGWLERNRHDPSIPPAFIDQIEMGRQHLGHDDFGWDELAAILGTAGFTAAVVASIVYSGGAATPLWVQAGLVGLAGAEAYASYKADDPVNAVIAGAGALADLIVAGRLIGEAHDAARLADTPLSILRPLRDELLAAAQRSELEAFRRLASEADALPPHVFIQQYEDLLEQERRLLFAGAPGDRYTPAQVALAIRKTGREVDWTSRQSAIEELLAAVPKAVWQEIIIDPKLMRTLASTDEARLSKAIEEAVVAVAPDDLKERVASLLANEAPAAKIEIDRLAGRIAGGLNGSTATPPLKGFDRAVFKIMTDYGGDTTKIGDLARNTIIVAPEDIGIAVQELRRLAKANKVKDASIGNDLGFTGFNVKIETRAGILAEVQVNSADVIYMSLEAAYARRALGDDVYDRINEAVVAAGEEGGRGHHYYEEWRVDPDSQRGTAIAAESEAYYARLKAIIREMEVPPWVTS